MNYANRTWIALGVSIVVAIVVIALLTVFIGWYLLGRHADR